MDKLKIEVACATPEHQVLLEVCVAAGTTLRQAVLQSGIQAQFARIQMGSAPLGIFGKAVPDAESRVVQAGDRIEVYRPLMADPKEVRKRRAERAKARSAAE